MTADCVDTAFVFNPSAQTGTAALRWDEIQRLAQEIGIGFERIDTLPDGQTPGMVEGLVKSGRYRSIVAFGGDGTISEVIGGIMQARDHLSIGRADLPILAVVPFGTGNNIAKSFGLMGISLQKTLETIRWGADFPLDLGKIGSRYFADGFSIGMDPHILRARNEERENIKRFPVLRQFLRDYMLYFYVIVRRPLPQVHVSAVIELDDRPPLHIDRLTNLIVNNVKVYAGEFVFEADSRANDGLLDVILFTGWRDYLSRFVMASQISPLNERMLNKVLARNSQNYQAKRIKITLEHKLGAQLDGELYTEDKAFEMECVENALTLKTPVS